VHIYGRVTCSHDADRLEDTVNALTKVNEDYFDQPWQPNFDKRMLNGIVGIELVIEEIQCQYKLNQNRSLAEQAEVATQLAQQGNVEMAEAMRAQSKLHTP
jgi:transcriptional regulator